MASLHNALRRGPWTGALKAVLGDTRSEGGIERYGETMQPTIDLWGAATPDFWLMRGCKLWSAVRDAIAVVGELSMFAITVPAASKVVAVVTAAQGAINVGGGTVRLMTVNRTSIAATLSIVAGTIHAIDGRDGNSAAASPGDGIPTVLEPWDGSDAVSFAAAGFDERQVCPAVANVMQPFFTLPRILRPGTGILIEGATANTAIRVHMNGYVRPALPGELFTQT